ncbi:MAG: hypothetical protein SFZ03_06720 [Candidatus Melainabacteria bacterium]|nr:hypothetical protein [Candidatus Melainabacteria bacterium]
MAFAGLYSAINPMALSTVADISLTRALPSVMGKGYLTYAQTRANNDPEVRDDIVLRWLVQSVVGTLFIQRFVGFYPIWVMLAASHNAGKADTPKEALQSFLQTTTTMGAGGYLGVWAGRFWASRSRAKENSALRQELTRATDGSYGTIHTICDRIAQKTNLAPEKRQALLESLKALDDKLLDGANMESRALVRKTQGLRSLLYQHFKHEPPADVLKTYDLIDQVIAHQPGKVPFYNRPTVANILNTVRELQQGFFSHGNSPLPAEANHAAHQVLNDIQRTLSRTDYREWFYPANVLKHLDEIDELKGRVFEHLADLDPQKILTEVVEDLPKEQALKWRNFAETLLNSQRLEVRLTRFTTPFMLYLMMTTLVAWPIGIVLNRALNQWFPQLNGLNNLQMVDPLKQQSNRGKDAAQSWNLNAAFPPGSDPLPSNQYGFEFLSTIG